MVEIKQFFKHKESTYRLLSDGRVECLYCWVYCPKKSKRRLDRIGKEYDDKMESYKSLSFWGKLLEGKPTDYRKNPFFNPEAYVKEWRREEDFELPEGVSLG